MLSQGAHYFIDNRNLVSFSSIGVAHMSIEQQHKIKQSYISSPQLVAVLLATLVLSGCGLNTTRIDAKDERVFTPALRIGINLTDGKQAAAEPQSGHAFEIGATKARGGEDHVLAAGQNPIVLNGTTFTSGQIRNDFDLGYGDISWRWRKFFDDRALGLEVTAGVGYSALDLTVSSPTQVATETFFTRGPQAGFGLIWRLDQSASVQARIGGFVSPGEYGVTNLSRYELTFAKAFLDNISLRAGYAGWNVYGQTRYDSSNFKLNFSGPVVSLNWDFSVNNRKIKVNREE